MPTAVPLQKPDLWAKTNPETYSYTLSISPFRLEAPSHQDIAVLKYRHLLRHHSHRHCMGRIHGLAAPCHCGFIA